LSLNVQMNLNVQLTLNEDLKKCDKKLTHDEFHQRFYIYALHRTRADCFDADTYQIAYCSYEKCTLVDRGSGYCYLHCSCIVCKREHVAYKQYCQDFDAHKK
jgi:hypothetical protein